MVQFDKLEVGQKVYYQPEHYKEKGMFENGMVRYIPDHVNDAVFVVYNCNNDWDNFKAYTAALTNIRDLHNGWLNKTTSND
jgi:hypothetical protein